MKTCSSAICISYALISSFAHAQSFFDDFEDNNLTDGSPVTWFGSFVDSGAVTADAGDMVIDPVAGASGIFPLATTEHRDVRSEVVFVAPEDDNIFMISNVRDTLNGASDQYWGGLFATGEIGLGFDTPSEFVVIERGVFLPTGPLSAGEEVTLQMTAIDNNIQVKVWETALGPDFSASISWTDPLNRFPDGNLAFPTVVFNGSNEPVRIRSFEVRVIPEPSTVLLFGLGLASTLTARRVR